MSKQRKSKTDKKIEQVSKPFTTVTSKKFTFLDADFKQSNGHVNAGDYLGEFQGKVKDKTSDSFIYKFAYPKDYNFSLIPNSNAYATTGGKPYYFLAEQDELKTVTPKIIGGQLASAVGNAGEDAAKAAKFFGIRIFEGVLIVLIGYILVEILIKKA